MLFDPDLQRGAELARLPGNPVIITNPVHPNRPASIPGHPQHTGPKQDYAR